MSRVLVLLLLCGCLEPLVDDAPGGSGEILPAGAEVPSAHDDPLINEQIAAADGVDGVIPRISGFADGAPIHYWNFGPAPSFAAPLFVLARRDGEELVPIAHNTIIDSIPGEGGYSPYWAVLMVEVTDAYAGELLTSVAAVQEAERRGLVLPPVQQAFGVNCPVVAREVALDVGAGMPLPPPTRFYWRGHTINYYEFGPMPLVDRSGVTASPRYVLRREGGEPLSEVDRGVDMTGDGDTTDTNDIFVATAEASQRSPHCRRVDVVVRENVASIDTSGDETDAELRAATQLLNPAPVAANVVSISPTEDDRNCPQQRREGDL